ncbi:MAG: hypothetical protein AAFV80_17530 [Bacteroidota bacterium]
MKRFPAKLLLFGEHALLCGARALAIPFDRFGGQWALAEESTEAVLRSQTALRQFANYIRESDVSDKYDWQVFLKDVEEGWFFDSDIPQGYGLGSSGALVAAFYDRYAIEKVDKYSPIELRKALRFLESYYHGSSSGIDPLVSYLGLPIIVHPDQQMESPHMRSDTSIFDHFFLLDSNLPRETGPLVNWFLKSMESKAYQDSFHGELKPAIEIAIEGIKWEKPNRLYTAFQIISEWQISGKMEPMVPEVIAEIWQSEHYQLKLCGAGGGGYFLGLARESFDWPEKIANFSVIPLVTRKNG